MTVKRWLVIPAAIVGILALAVLSFPPTRWRLNVLALKMQGRLETVGWKQLLHMMNPNSGISLGSLALSGNPYAAIRNPLESKDDQARGNELFDRRCSQCHGYRASGGEGPALVGRELSHGDSDWAIFLTISKGVAGTAMRPSGLADDEVWRLISYLRSIEDTGSLLDNDDGAPATRPVRDTSYAMLRDSSGEPGDWLLPSGSYSSQRFSKDTQISTRNVGQLAVKWIYQFGTSNARVESVPIVADGRMYVTLPSGTVIALDAESGAELWKYTRTPPQDVVLCCVANRGVAVLGKRVYVGTLDAHLLALDATNGKLVWDQTVANYHEGYAITSAPLALDKLIVTGIAGGDFPTRGFISAYDSDTGVLRWRFKSIPEPGEPGNDTWGGESWRTGGVSTWMTGSFDPDLGLIYWGTGNPSPDLNAASRPGDNLYSNCVVALDAATGKLAWYFQFTPGDDHDWDSVQTPILIDANESGMLRKLLVVANRNGFFYVLDRQSGQFVRGAPYVKQTWAIGLRPEGRPIRSPDASPSLSGTRLFPGMSGATNTSKSAYSPLTRLYYAPVLERSGVFFQSEDSPEPRLDQQFLGSTVEPVRDVPHYTAVRAIDPATAKVRWEYRRPQRYVFSGGMGGLLVTAGGLVFTSDQSRLYALDAETGAELLSFETGGEINSAPMTYRASGRQYLAIAAGNVLVTFSVPNSNVLQQTPTLPHSSRSAR
jgi:alcohol dehydrogenase (cytochrome c)